LAYFWKNMVPGSHQSEDLKPGKVISLAILAFVAWSSNPQATELMPLGYLSPPSLPVVHPGQ
jgi:hypothetical protein